MFIVEGEDMKQLSTLTIILLLLSYATGYADGDDGPYKTTFSHYKKPGQPKTPVRSASKVNYAAKIARRTMRGRR